MTPDVLDYVKRTAQLEPPGRRVLDVGSFDVNGTIRPAFSTADEIVGLDLRPGPNVDVVADVEEFARPAGAGVSLAPFDLVVSAEMLEHTPHPWLAVEGMVQVLRPGGRLILTTRSAGFGRHDYPADYWRFSPEALRILFEDVGLVDVEVEEDPDQPGAFATGIRPGGKTSSSDNGRTT